MGRVSSSFSVWSLTAAAPMLVACGESRHEGNRAPAAMGTGGSSLGGSSTGGASVTAGRDTADAGTSAGGQSAAGRSTDGGGSGRATAGASGTTGGVSGMTGGAGGTTGGMSGTTGGMSGTTGGVSGMASGDAGESSGGAAEECGLEAAPVSCNGVSAGYAATIIDFTRYSSGGKWSTATANGVTGRTSLYHSSLAEDVVLVAKDGTLHVTATLPSMTSAGWVFAFDMCTTGEVTDIGLTFPLAGDLGGATMTVLAQTNADYPVGLTTGRGACTFTSCATMTSECRAPSYEIRGESPLNGVEYEQWSAFTGGMPESYVPSAGGFLGIQFELRCTQSTECVVDLTLGTVKFFSV